MVFYDCLGREIKVGDVIASGHRDHNVGSLAIGVVTGFDGNRAIKVTKFERGHWHKYGKDLQWRMWMPQIDGDEYREVKGRCAYGERCFVTGLSEDELRARLPVRVSDDHA